MSGRGSPRWGWYRLDAQFAIELVAASDVTTGDLVLDLGAGDGAITEPLAAAGARVLAFELHAGRCAELRRRFESERRVKVVRADVTDLRLPSRRFHVVANPPFDGVSSILTRLTSRHSRLETATLVLPASVAARWTHRLDRTASWRALVVRRLPRRAFTPRPRIDCCVMRIERR